MLYMEFFHIYNRGTDKRNIVMDDYDRHRFLQGLYMYNDKNIIDRNQRRAAKNRRVSPKRDPLVYVHAYCLMNNHYHLLISPVDDDIANLSAYMRKLNMGYSKYFNEKHTRSGSLWESKYKKVHIEKDSQFIYIPYYIHLNPLDYKFPAWRQGNIPDRENAYRHLYTYKWSSFCDYNGVHNYPSILHTSTLSETLSSQENQKNTIAKIISGGTLDIIASQLEYE